MHNYTQEQHLMVRSADSSYHWDDMSIGASGKVGAEGQQQLLSLVPPTRSLYLQFGPYNHSIMLIPHTTCELLLQKYQRRMAAQHASIIDALSYASGSNPCVAE